MPAARSRRQAAIERGTHGVRFRPDRKGTRPFARRRDRQHRPPPRQSGHVNLIDTPGYPDFRGPTLSALAAVETVAIVRRRRHRRRIRHAPHDGVRQGAQPVPRASSSTRSTTPSAKLARACSTTCARAFGPECLPLNLPADGGKRVVDCFGSTAGDGDSDLGPVADWHQKIIDQVVEVNETVMDHYLDQGEAGLSGPGTARRLRAMPARRPPGAGVLRLARAAAPACKELLDIAEKLFPHPGEGNPPPFVKGTRRRRRADRGRSPIRRRTSSPTSSRSSTIPSSASSASSASTRAR